MVIRRFGRASTPLTLWLLLVLAVALLINISTTAAARSAEMPGPGPAPAGDVDRGIGALRAFTERIDRPVPVIPAAYVIHPSIGDGGPEFVRAAAGRVITMVERRLSRLAADGADDPATTDGLTRLGGGLQELRRTLVALGARGDPAAATRQRIEAETVLLDMHRTWAALDPAISMADRTPALPVVIRGAEL